MILELSIEGSILLIYTVLTLLYIENWKATSTSPRFTPGIKLSILLPPATHADKMCFKFSVSILETPKCSLFCAEGEEGESSEEKDEVNSGTFIGFPSFNPC